MANKGFSHIGLSTLDFDKTVEFYQDVLGFRMVRSTRSRSSRAVASATLSSMRAATS